jgi:cholesterol oxidase
MENYDFDYLIIGSGFGGSVSATRLSEKGYSVGILEQGKRFRDHDFAVTNWNLRKYLWAPILKCFGIQNISLFKNVMVLGGTGVGGGSLVYANTLMKPSDSFFNAPSWKDLADWKNELEPHYQTASRMLGATPNPNQTPADKMLHEIANEMGRGHTYKTVNVGVFFGEAGKKVSDPYFKGEGPDRVGCTQCGGCMVGCRYGAKNTLEKNYLYFAEKFGAKILPERKVKNIRPINGMPEKGYEIETIASTAWFRKDPQVFRAKKVIVSAGVLGSLRLLLKCKYQTKSLPNLSDQLGQQVRTNNEALVGITESSSKRVNDHSRGIAITSIFHPDDHTHVEPVRYSKGSNLMSLLGAPMIDGDAPLLRPFKLLWTLFRYPLQTLNILWKKRWSEKSIILLVMQTLDYKMKFQLGRNLFTLFRKDLVTKLDKGAFRMPTYIPIGNEVARLFSKKINGVPQNAVNEVLLNIPTTAHILGGCPIGGSAQQGVIDTKQEVFNYPGLYICDGSAIPANLGVNPSLTITAMTERAMSLIPKKT